MIYISHALDEVIRLADHVVIVEAGRVVRFGPLLETLSDPTLSPHLGRFEAGSVLACQVASHDPAMASSALTFAGGTLRVPQVTSAVGTKLRIRIRARDVSLALSEPQDVSITNRLAGTLTTLTPEGGRAGNGPYVDAAVAIGPSILHALITRESVARLRLTPGMPVWALIKTVSFDRRSG